MEFFYVLFLLSGQFKAYLMFFGIELPVDLTLLTGVLVVGLTGYKMIRQNSFNVLTVSFYGIGLLLLFYAWMVFSLFYTASEEYSLEKTVFFLLNIVAFAIPFFFKEFNLRRFIRYFALGTIFLAICFLPFKYLNLMESPGGLKAEDPFNAIAGLYLSLSQYLGLVAVLLLTKVKEPVFTKRLDLLIVAIVVVVLALLGARAPILFAVIVYGLYYLNSIHVITFNVKKRTVWWIGGGTVMLIVAIFLMLQFESTATLISRSIGRFTSLFDGVGTEGSTDDSTGDRILFAQQSFEGIFHNLRSLIFGYGIGSFGIITQGLDTRYYPHNLILEIWFELGLVGVSLFVAWIAYLLLELRKMPNKLITYWLFLYIFLNLMKSSSLVDIRVEFAFFALFAVQNFLIVKARGQEGKKARSKVLIQN